MPKPHHSPHARWRSLLTPLVLGLGLLGTSVLSGCERRLGEDERLIPAQPRPDTRPDARPDQPAR